METKANEVQKLREDTENLRKRGDRCDEEIKKLQEEVHQKTNSLCTAHGTIQELKKSIEEQRESLRDMSNKSEHVTRWLRETGKNQLLTFDTCLVNHSYMFERFMYTFVKN